MLLLKSMWKIAPPSLLITGLGDWRAEKGDFIYQILPDSFFNPFNFALPFTSIMLMA